MSDKSTSFGHTEDRVSDNKGSQSEKSTSTVGFGGTTHRENESISNKIAEKTTETLSDATTEGKKGIKKFLSCEDGGSEIKSITLGLFGLIGFIILVYAIFVAAVGPSLASIADTVFIAALIGSFTLVGTIISQIYLRK